MEEKSTKIQSFWHHSAQIPIPDFTIIFVVSETDIQAHIYYMYFVQRTYNCKKYFLFKAITLSLPWWWLPIFTKMDKSTCCRNLLPRYFPASCTRRKMATTQKSCDGRKSTSSTWFPELSTVLAKKSRCPSTSIHRQSNYNITDTKQKLFPLWWNRWHRLFSGRISI